MNSIASHFDKEATTYPTDLGADFVQARKWALVSEHAHPGGMALDIGAASGRHAMHLARLGVTVVSVDPSAQMRDQLAIRRTQEGLDDRLYICGAQLPDLPFAPHSFDLLYCYSTLLLLPPDAQVESLRHMSSLLRPDGMMIVDIAGAGSLAIRYWRRHYRRRGFAGVFGMKQQQIRTTLEQAGMVAVTMEPHGSLSQLLLAPGMERISPLVRRIRGSAERPGWDVALSRITPGFAERWYVAARRARPVGLSD